MFQTFEPISDRSFAGKHLPLLRAEMKARYIDGIIVPHDDEYQNEYIPAYAERLMWVSGFSGSAGGAIIFHDSAVIFTDGRYTLQVRQQADADYFTYVDITQTTPDQWLKAGGAKKSARIGYDPMLHTGANVKLLREAAENAGFDLVRIIENPINAAWKDQPPHPKTPAKPHGEEFAGKLSAEKRGTIAKQLREAGADGVLITAPPSVAWLLNIRGADVARTPLPLSRALLKKDGKAVLFIAPEKIDNTLPGFLGDDVEIRTEGDVGDVLRKLGGDGAAIAIDPALTPSKFVDELHEAGARVVNMTDPCALPRAAKNDIEISGARAAHIRDGAAVTKFLHWLDNEAPIGRD